MLRKIFVFLFSLVLVLGLIPTLSVNAYSTGTWMQTDWSDGEGQTNWSDGDVAAFLSSSQINYATANSIKLSSTYSSWAQKYGGIGKDFSKIAKQTTDGGYIVAASFDNQVGKVGDYDIWILKLDSSGNVTWQKTYGITQKDDTASSIQQTSDGGYIVAGSATSFGAGSADFWVLKLDSSGAVTWQKTYGGTGDDFAYSIQQISDGGYIVAGSTSSFGAGGSDAWVLKLDSSGAVTWQKTYGGTGDESFNSIQQISDGGYIVAGDTESFGAGGSDAWILKLDSSGAVTWQKTYGGTDTDRASSAQPTSDGGYIVAGQGKLLGGSFDAWILKLDSSGAIGSSCSAIADSTATPADSDATPANSTATPADSTATLADSDATPTDPPSLTDLQCSVASGYYSSGTLTSSTYDSGVSYTIWGPLTYTGVTPVNTSFSFEISTTNGVSWQTVSDYTQQTFGPSQTLTYRVTLSNTDGISTPTLNDVSINYAKFEGVTPGQGANPYPVSSPTPTPTPTPTASPSPSASPSISATSTPSITPSPSPAPTPSPAISALQQQVDSLISQLKSLIQERKAAGLNVPAAAEALLNASLQASFNRDLSLGSRGADVKLLQQSLNKLGFKISTGWGSPGYETEYFGFKTYQALLKFQKAYNLSQTGKFESLTRAKMNELVK